MAFARAICVAAFACPVQGGFFDSLNSQNSANSANGGFSSQGFGSSGQGFGSTSAQGQSGQQSSMTDMFKSAFCSVMKVEMICGSHGGAVQKCSGSGCCVQSSCYSDSMPMVSCNAERGSTVCIGASMFSMSAGMCQCQSGQCNSQGKCQDAGDNSFHALYEDNGEPLPHEMGVLARLAPVWLFAFVLLLSGLALRSQRRYATVAVDTEGNLDQALSPASSDDGLLVE